MKVKLPILFNTDSTEKMNDCDIECPIEDYEAREMVFYQISSIYQHFEQDIELCLIRSDGKQFMCTLLVSEVEKIIDKCKSMEYSIN